MGVAGADLMLMMNLHEAGHLPRHARILDLGAQNLYCAGQDAIVAQFLETFAPGQTIDPKRVNALANRGYAGDLFTLAGFTYTCVDVFAAPHGIVFDLNFDPMPAELRGVFDLVMNHGTTEHLLNQFHAFRLVHEFTKPGGVMVHSLPFQGYVDHGFFSYSGKFFKRLAEFNNYKTLEIGFSENRNTTRTPPYVTRTQPTMRAGGGFQSDQIRDASVFAILQRQTADGFVPPLDVEIMNMSREDVARLMARSDQLAASVPGGAPPARSPEEIARAVRRVRRYSLIYPIKGLLLRLKESLSRLRRRWRSA